jgi:4-amino-4-deoxy-L-arabinose transferase-like glycosyltransferase
MGANKLLAVVALGVALRLAFGFGYWIGQPLTRDESEYLSLARSLRSGAGFVYDAAHTDAFGRAPGYPAFLAVAGGGHGTTSTIPALVTITQSLVGGLGIVLAAALAARVAGPRAALAAAMLTAVYPPLVWIASRAFSEALFWPMGLGVAWLFDRATTAAGASTRARLALLCGLLAGAGVLVRPALLFFLMLAALYWLWSRRWVPLAALTVGALLVVGPWTARNVMVHGRFVLVASEGGVTFWTGNHPLAVGDGDMAANPAIKRDYLRLRAQFPQLSEEAMEPIFYREALAWIRANPLDWVALEARKVFYTVVPVGPSYFLHSRLFVAASIVPYGLALAGALAGAWRWRDRLAAIPGLWLLAASALLVCVVFFPQERFRVPVIDPALLVLAAAACVPRRALPPAAAGRVAA